MTVSWLPPSDPPDREPRDEPQTWGPPAPAPESGQQQWGQQQQWGPQQPAPGGGRTPGKATAALVLGILGLLICPPVCSTLALVFGYQSRREIDADPMLGGRGLSTAGIVLGWVGLALMILFAIYVVAVGVGTN